MWAHNGSLMEAFFFFFKLSPNHKICNYQYNESQISSFLDISQAKQQTSKALEANSKHREDIHGLRIERNRIQQLHQQRKTEKLQLQQSIGRAFGHSGLAYGARSVAIPIDFCSSHLFESRCFKCQQHVHWLDQ